MPGQKGRNPAKPEFHGSRRSWSGSWFLTVVAPLSESVGKPTCTSLLANERFPGIILTLARTVRPCPWKIWPPRGDVFVVPRAVTLLVHTLSAKFRCDLAICNIAEYLKTNI